MPDWLAGHSISAMLGAAAAFGAGMAFQRVLAAYAGWRGARAAVPAARKGLIGSARAFVRRAGLLVIVAIILIAGIIARSRS